jgi:hypothetical protein
MRTLLIAFAVLVATAASAQQQTTQPVRIRAPNGTDTLRVLPADCGRELTFTWTATGRFCEGLSLWLTRDADCRDNASAQTTQVELTTISLDTINTQRGTGQSTFAPARLPFPEGATCGAPGLDLTFRLCGATRGPDAFGFCTTTGAVVRASPLRIFYDTLPPGAPTIESVLALDRALRVEVSVPEDATRVRLEVLRLDGALVTNVEQTREQGSFTVRELQNNETYELRAYAIDASGNVSEAFATAQGTPIKTLGFYERYLELGGQETGGCGAAGGGGVAGGAVLAVLGFWLSSRRKRS